MEVVSDCNAVLERHQGLVERRTDIRNFSRYCKELVSAVTAYANGRHVMLPPRVQLEDCQLLALSVLYRTAIFVLRVPQNEWSVYNQVHILHRAFIALFPAMCFR